MDLIEFKVKDLQLEASPLCSSDFLAFYKNNEIKSDNLIAKLCGNEKPSNEIRARGTILANFVTNEEIEDLGWLVEFNIEPCGEEIVDKNGVISNYHMPNENDDFAHSNLDCTWVLTAESEEMVIQVKKWTQFDIEYRNGTK